MTTGSVIYWIGLAASLYAAYLICFCLCEIDSSGNKTDNHIAVPRILYLLTFAVSFVPIVNFLFGIVVIIVSIIANYQEEDWYFKSWLLDKPKQKDPEQ